MAHPSMISIGEFHDGAKELIRQGNLAGALDYIKLRGMCKDSSQQLFEELTAETGVEESILRDIMIEGLDEEADDPESQEFGGLETEVEELQSQGIVSTEGEDDDPDEELNPYQMDPSIYGDAIDLEDE